MTSLFERALGEEWADLHPQLRDRYGVRADENREVVGTGTMERLDRHPLAVPVLWLGTFDDFLFPERGTDVPFTITTEPFVDAEGYEALVLRRRFELSRPREFVDTLRWHPDRGCLIEYLGRSGRLVSELHLRADDDALALSFGAQWLRVGGRYVRVPGPLAVDGALRDWYDDDAGRFEVAAEITSPLLGEVFGYRGRFENAVRSVESRASSPSSLRDVDLPGAKP